MAVENIKQELRLKSLDKTRNYFLEIIKQNELMSRKHKNVCATLNYIEHFLILASTSTRSVSISAYASLIGIPLEITSFEVALKVCTTTAGAERYKSLIKKKKKQTR